jgi:hypothetical protein
MMMNLILGTAVGYDIAALQPFVSSLIRSNYKGRIVLFVDDLNNNAAEYLCKQQIEIIPFEATGFPIYIRRFFLYKGFLEEQHDIGQVMLTDVRDVIFQDDPFTFCDTDNLYCFEEDSTVPLLKCPVNTAWILQAYGIQGLDAIGDNSIICAGVTVGSYKNIRQYLERFCKELLKLPPVWGIDQAAHNFLIRSGIIGNNVVCANDSGPVYTLALVKPGSIKIDEKGFIVNGAGVPCIVHQYDRHPILEKILREKYFSF